MKRLLIWIIALVTLACLVTLALARLTHTDYVIDQGMRETKFWSGRARYLIPAGDPYFPIQIPGPLDAWARGEPKRVELVAPYQGRTLLILDILDSHQSAPPRLEVRVNGRLAGFFQVIKGRGTHYPAWQWQGRHSHYELVLPAGLFHSGRNIISIGTVSGSWVAVGGVRLQRLAPVWVQVLGWAGLAFLILYYLWYLAKRRLWLRHLGNACLVALSLVLALGAAELVLRWFFPQRQYVPQLRIVYEPDPDMGYRLKPNVHTDMGFDTNHLGLRDYQHYRRQKPAGVYRILCLGDSFTFSITSLADSYPKQLEKLLASAPRKIEVLNCGVSGYGTDNEYYYFKKVALGLQPDLVLVGFYVGNDISDNYDHPSYTAIEGILVRRNKARRLSAEDIRRMKRRKLFWESFHLVRLIKNLEYSGLFRSLRRLSSDTRRKMNQERSKCVADTNRRIHLPPEQFSPALKVGWQKTLDYLERMYQLARQRGVKLCVVLIPDAMQFDTPEVLRIKKALGDKYQWDQPQKALLAQAARRGWLMLDVAPYMRAHWQGEQIFYCGDTHFNERGNRLLARALAHWLRGYQPELFAPER